MPEPVGRDLEKTRIQLRDWIASKLPAARDLELSPLRGPGTTGFSSDTLMFDLRWREAGRERSEALVVRIEPTGVRVFPHYDIGLQYRVIEILGRAGIPVPRVHWFESDPSVLGAPFFVMERVEGKIPPDSPTYHTAGWVTEAAPEERAAIWWSGLEVLARIHRLDWKALGFGFLDRSESDRTPLERQLQEYRDFLDWAREGDPFPLAEQALAWLTSHRPAEEPVALCWGDSRLGNMIFRDGRCVAVLDWEMVTLGNPEQDFAWWLFFDAHHSAGVGAERLPGFPSREESIERYQRWLGREVKHLDYYEIFAATRFAVIMLRLGRELKRIGFLPADSDFETNNPCTRMLEQMLERAA